MSTRRVKLEALLDRDPGDPFLHFGLAMEFIKEGLVESALERFDRAIALDPEYTAAFFQKGQTLIQMNRVMDARNVLQAGVLAANANGNAHAASEMQELLDTLD